MTRRISAQVVNRPSLPVLTAWEEIYYDYDEKTNGTSSAAQIHEVDTSECNEHHNHGTCHGPEGYPGKGSIKL
jgi:hypothetical protein